MKYVFFFLVIVAAGCHSSSTNADATWTNNRMVKATSTTEGNKGTEIMVQLTGGNNTGTYKASSSEFTCSQGLTGEKSFGNQYSETGKGDKELSSVQMMVDNYDEAKKGTSNFNVMFSFGSLINGTSYSLDPTKNVGTGKLTITENGGAKIATIDGKTKEGVGIHAVITCKTVAKMVNGELKEQ